MHGAIILDFEVGACEVRPTFRFTNPTSGDVLSLVSFRFFGCKLQKLKMWPDDGTRSKNYGITKGITLHPEGEHQYLY